MPFYVPPKEQSFDMDKEPNYIVPVIASFSTKGGVQPLYFQFDDKTIKVMSVHWCEKKLNTVCFECTAELEGYLTKVNLTFFPADNQWRMKPK
ncbi:hypothetical protein D7V86_17595 [bacterium D16-51]|nr:hypothetical protein D7V96_17720 [bacterium D16-59]RKI57464.1 hypothetical protein D7V86_17595 [bacterium D16-51]